MKGWYKFRQMSEQAQKLLILITPLTIAQFFHDYYVFVVFYLILFAFFQRSLDEHVLQVSYK